VNPYLDDEIIMFILSRIRNMILLQLRRLFSYVLAVVPSFGKNLIILQLVSEMTLINGLEIESVRIHHCGLETNHVLGGNIQESNENYELRIRTMRISQHCHPLFLSSLILSFICYTRDVYSSQLRCRFLFRGN